MSPSTDHPIPPFLKTINFSWLPEVPADDIRVRMSGTNPLNGEVGPSLPVHDTLPIHERHSVDSASPWPKTRPPSRHEQGSTTHASHHINDESSSCEAWDEPAFGQFHFSTTDFINQHADPTAFQNHTALDAVIESPVNIAASRDDQVLPTAQMLPPKIGTRFSSGAKRVLNSWMAEHSHHPYPTANDIEIIQVQTGLARQQVITWFRNARRHRKTQIPTRPPTPIPRRIESDNPTKLNQQTSQFQHMNPLQRWQNSPPEHEPAAASAIAQAVSGLDISRDLLLSAENVPSVGSWQDDSSAGSVHHSQFSNSSWGSAWSEDSRLSSEAVDYRPKHPRRRKRRTLALQSALEGCRSLGAACHIYQCTFCTETFKTKHNWQRHEKSLHLSLEQWECSPEGPFSVSDCGRNLTCTFCGQINPGHAHLLEHNYTTCLDRLPNDRTFYRKDHLQQHLKLVHQCSFMKDPMEGWRRNVQALRSRCGFCDLQMNTWAQRVDHIADHFKQGKSMADWKGSWGFDSHVLDMVENSMPPCTYHWSPSKPFVSDLLLIETGLRLDTL